MKTPFVRVFVASAAALAAFLAVVTPALAGPPRVLAIHFDNDLEINPVTQDYFTHELQHAADAHYDAVVILLDTPGGLLQSMRVMYQKELASPIPVIVYVAPNGARAGSAGVWISEAADVLAMAPESNIGASTPIDSTGGDIKGALGRKIRNDAAASLRALTKSHGRNVAFAHDAVFGAASLTAQEALRDHVIDVIAPTLPALLKQLDGRRTVGPRRYTLHLAGAQITEVRPGFFARFLNVLIDPNLIFLLFLAGVVGIGYEVFHPGVVLPGALGAVALITSLFGAFVLPISWAGVLLVLLGIALLVIDAHVTTHGALTLAGLVSLVIGGLILFRNAPAPYRTSTLLVSVVAVVLGGLWAFAITKAVQVRRRPAAVGPQHIVGMTGEVRGGGFVFVNGELWRAAADGSPLRTGDAVRVTGIDGLVLHVSPLVPEPSSEPRGA